MTRRTIIEYPHPGLRKVSDPVTDFGDDLGQLVDDLIDTMNSTPGIALSAPQLDDHRAVLVMRNGSDDTDAQIFINPEILSKTAWGLVEESCLSLPGVSGTVFRATQLTVRAQDRHGQTFTRDLSEMGAVCLQHEMDHLAGKLFIDRMSIFRRLHFHAKEALKQRRSRNAA